MPRTIEIFDTTLQMENKLRGIIKCIQLEIARQLAKLSVDAIEAGFPIASRVILKVKTVAGNIKVLL